MKGGMKLLAQAQTSISFNILMGMCIIQGLKLIRVSNWVPGGYRIFAILYKFVSLETP